MRYEWSKQYPGAIRELLVFNLGKQQGLVEFTHPVGGSLNVIQQGGLCFTQGLLEEQLQFGLHDGQRCLQFVGSVLNELFLRQKELAVASGQFPKAVLQLGKFLNPARLESNRVLLPELLKLPEGRKV